MLSERNLLFQEVCCCRAAGVCGSRRSCLRGQPEQTDRGPAAGAVPARLDDGIRGFRPDIAGLSFGSIASASALVQARRTKALTRETIIAVGGVRSSAEPVAEGLGKAGVDCVSPKEGEAAFTGIVEAVIESGTLTPTPGLGLALIHHWGTRAWLVAAALAELVRDRPGAPLRAFNIALRRR